MLNPSTADESTNDPTIARCEQRARLWGYGGVTVTNLFAFCSTEPSVLYRAVDPVGPENDAYLRAAALAAKPVICAWGVHGKLLGRSAVVLSLLEDAGIAPYCLARTRDGEPGHPLYLGYDSTPVVYGR
jgi:hypothetical protein